MLSASRSIASIVACHRRNCFALRRLRKSHAHYIRRNASAVRVEPFERSAPLEPVQRISMYKESRRASAVLHVCDPA